MRFHLLLGSLLVIAATVMPEDSDTLCDTLCTTKYTTELVYDTIITPRPINCFSIPVTYYDYHVDGSNPDFGFRVTSRWEQSGLSYANIHGWVDSSLSQETMSPQRHPALTDTFLDISWNISRLFKPWEAGSVDTFVLKFPPFIKDTVIDTLIVTADTTYDPADSTMTIRFDTATYFTVYDTIPTPDTIMISDTMFKNIVITDSLLAYWIPNESTYEDTTDTLWTFGKLAKMDPLNGRGFGNESDSTMNGGYTLHVHNKFTYKGGERIYFAADDDAYLFINGRLAIDCGGFHEALIDSLLLDSFHLDDGSPLTLDEKYDIDIFMIERRMGGNFYLAGLSEFEARGAMRVDTMYDTLLSFHYDTIKTETTCNIRCTGTDPRSAKNRPQIRTLLGLNIPPSAAYAALEYFTISGRRVMDRKMSLSQATVDKYAGLPWGMYLIRVNFLDERGKHLSKPSFRRIMAKR